MALRALQESLHLGGFMDIQRLRNLTTGRLHTDVDNIYLDLESITGIQGLMTHMLPRAMRAIEPWLRKHVKESRFWEDKYDVSHTGEFELPNPTDEDRKEFETLYLAQPSPFE